MINALTIDVEDYYMVSAFADVVPFSAWGAYESRVEKNTCRILELLDGHGTKATFFILGWVAERCPGLVRKIHTAGHEVACHGYNHRLIYDLSPAEFREDVRKAKSILENISGSPVIGYRAASYSIIQETLWALDILMQEGFQYDSSIFPIHHDRYGMPNAERFSYMIKRSDGALKEFPPSTYRVLGQNIPIAGGGYLRLFPLQITKTAIRQINAREEQPVIVYLHPWEIDVDQPKVSGRRSSVLRHRINLHTTLPKLNVLLQEFKFQPLSAFLS